MATRTLQVGDKLEGKYSIVDRLGEGGMGSVFLARHDVLGEMVAIKTIHPELLLDATIISRFINEARAAARLRTEHVVKILDVGTSEAVGPFIVMERLEGQTVTDYLESRPPLAAREAVDLVLPALEALAMAHAAGIVHRDLKPSNLFIAKVPGGRSVIKILDFGIAKATGEADVSTTSTKATLGSPLYMSPEQAKSARRADARSDLWSVGVILYELVTKQIPFNGETVGEVIASILSDEPIDVRQHIPDLPVAFANLIHRGLLVKDKEGRVPSVLALAQELAPFASPEVAPYVVRIREVSLTGPAPTSSNPISVEPARASTPALEATALAITTPQPVSERDQTVAAAAPVRTDPATTPSPRRRSTLPTMLAIAAALLVAGVGAVVYGSRLTSSARAEPAASAPAPASAISVAAAPASEAPSAPVVATPQPTPSALASTKPAAETSAPSRKLPSVKHTPDAGGARPAAPASSMDLSSTRQSW